MQKSDNPLIVQSDRTLLLDVHAPRAKECRNALIPFAELVSSPEHLHTYRLTPLSLWNAAGAGFTGAQAVQTLAEFSRYDVPQAVSAWIEETAGRFGRLRLVPAPPKENEGVKDEYLYLVSTSALVYREISANPAAQKLLVPCTYTAFEGSAPNITEEEKQFCFLLHLTDRGTVKQALLRLGWPVKDDVPLADGAHLDIKLRETTLGGKPFSMPLSVLYFPCHPRQPNRKEVS